MESLLIVYDVASKVGDSSIAVIEDLNDIEIQEAFYQKCGF
jgi:hypothetical protein